MTENTPATQTTESTRRKSVGRKYEKNEASYHDSVPVGHIWKSDLDLGIKNMFLKNSNRPFHAQASRDKRKSKTNQIRRLELDLRINR